jgi:hypothetical protein
MSVHEFSNLVNRPFDEMNWHDNIVYSISLPSENLTLGLDIDHILEWKLPPDSPTYNFVVAPALLLFENVSELKLNLSFGEYCGICIEVIKRGNPKLSPNGSVILWDFQIETDRGLITFISTGFVQKLVAEPQEGKSQKFNRGHLKNPEWQNPRNN